MAAYIRRNGLVMCAMALMALLSVAHQARQAAGRVIEKDCPTTDYAYPFQSTCQYPAQFGTPYHLVSPFSNAAVAVGGLTPTENGYVRFTGDKEDEGAAYVLKPVQQEGGEEDAKNITVGPAQFASVFTIQNVATKKYLAYPFFGGVVINKAVLSEVEEDFVGSHIAQFKLEEACGVPLPCGTAHGARCLSYNLKVVDLDNTVYPLFRDGVVYAAVNDRDIISLQDLPFLLRRVKSNNMQLTQQSVAAA